MQLISIPKTTFPKIKEPMNATFINEPIVSLSSLQNFGIRFEPKYYLQNIPGATKNIYARKKLMRLLLKAEKSLPDGYHLKIYDAYRPIKVQQYLWDKYRNKILENPINADKTSEEIDELTSHFVSKPSYDINCPSVHNTGGAVDLTIVDDNDNELDMGTEFDDFTDKAWTDYYEHNNIDENIRNNRRLLYTVMKNTGFTNLPSEWWHYDYGTKFWAHYNRQPMKYLGVLEIKE